MTALGALEAVGAYDSFALRNAFNLISVFTSRVNAGTS
jgi:hypothetical protein